MTSLWRDQILREFTPQVARLTLVSDPDGLLLDEGVAEGLNARGFDILPFDDPVAFRFAYESRYRSRWDGGEQADRVVVLRTPAQDLRFLPFDLLQAGRRLSFGLSDFFPNLSYPVIAAMDRGDLDNLYRAQVQYAPDRLGDHATMDFVLRHVFEVAPELVREPQDLLRLLLRRHYQGGSVPAAMDDRFIHLLRRDGRFEDWPLEQIVPDREEFFAFLQERWPAFLDRQISGHNERISESAAAYLAYAGPAALPFDHDDVRIYVDSLFLEGHLRPVSHPQAEVLSRGWMAVGLHIDPAADRLRRLLGLLGAAEVSVPEADARHHDWLAFSHRWAELVVLWHTHSLPDGSADTEVPTEKIEIGQRIRELQVRVDTAFLAWVKKRYGGLHNQPAIPPVMVHHIPRMIARYLEDHGKDKAAFVLLDGLAFDQWIVLRDVLLEQRPDLHFREEAVFAWVPTLTSVSRQAAFAGKAPVYFPDSIHSTDKEEVLWTRFWVDQGLTPMEVAYARGLGAEATLPEVEAILSHPRIRVVGLVVDKVDRIMHGMALGTAGMHNQVRQWAGEGFMASLLDLLLDSGFDIFLSSDHGNIEAAGCGRPAEGAVADLRGERARAYPDPLLRKRVKERFPEAIEWPPIGLPGDYLPLLAPSRSAFVREGERIVAHGGISLEELVVPFIQVGRRSAGMGCHD